MSSGHKFFSHIDLLRISSALLIVIFHLEKLNFETSYFSSFYWGVSIFFVISGFLMGHNFNSYSKNILLFLKSRFIRIYPLFWIVCSFILVMYSYDPHFRQLQYNPYENLIKNLLLIFDSHEKMPAILGIAWSLKYEVLFYLAVAGLVLVKDQKKLILRIYLFILIVMNLLRMFKPSLEIPNFFFWRDHFFTFFFSFYMGMNVKVKKIQCSLSLYFSLILLFIFSLYVLNMFVEQREVISYFITLFGLFIIMKFEIMAMKREKLMRNISLMTYPLYLVHIPIIFITRNLMGQIFFIIISSLFLLILDKKIRKTFIK